MKRRRKEQCRDSGLVRSPLHIGSLTAVVMIAFAANSVLNRAALADGSISPMAFAALRLISGAAVLAILSTARSGASWLNLIRPSGAGSLAVYVLGFSGAYTALDAGAGALILFGGVQITMFAGGVIAGEAIPMRRWAGSALALIGLCWMLWPDADTDVSAIHSGLMAAAALGWGIYSLLGRGSRDPLGQTAVSFLAATPFGLIAWLVVPGDATGQGMLLAVISGAITSGLGYALWYAVLPALGASRAAVSQLLVPVIAIAGGTLFLGEDVDVRLAVSCLLVTGGVALGLIPSRRAPGT